MTQRFGFLAVLGFAAALAMAPPADAQMRAQFGEHAAASRQVGFDVYLPPRDRPALDQFLADLHRPGSPNFHHWLTPDQFAQRFGAAPGDVARIAAELRAAGLAAAANGSQSIHVSGPAATIERVFATRLSTGHFARGADRLVAETPLSLPHSIADAGGIIVHFAPVNHMRTHVHTAPLAAGDGAGALNRYSATGSYWYDDLKQAYSFPSVSVVTGAGAHIGILMSGNYNPADIGAYFSHEGLAEPAFSFVDVEGGAPFNANGDSVETELDLQQSGGMAPGAAITLYNIPDLSDASILAGLVTIVEANTSDVVSMSFGGPELGYSPAYNGGVNYSGIMTVYNDLFMQGSAQGMTFVASSGDSGGLVVPAAACFAAGATAGCGSMVRGVDMPAASPYVTSVGGTNLVTAHSAIATNLTSTYVSEAAMYDPLTSDIFFGTHATGAVWGSGGGVSTFFAQPSYQAGISNISSRFRLVPDLSLHMGGCPTGAVQPCGPNRSTDVAIINSNTVGLIGTSAAAPAFAGLLALKVQLTGKRLGNENVAIYAMAAAQSHGTGPRVFRTNIQGNNGAYSTSSRYNPVLGNGSVIAYAYLGTSALQLAGVPQSASNP